MKLQIISPEQTKIFMILWLEALTAIGSFVIQSGHAPMVLILSPGKEITFGLMNDKQESIIVPYGILEITRTQAILLINKLS